MLEIYPAKYIDQFGEEHTIIQNDGKDLRMTLRGVEFVSQFFDDWEPTIPLNANQASRFNLHEYGEAQKFIELRDYILECEQSVPVFTNGKITQACLRVHFELGKHQASNGGTDKEIIKLELQLGDKTFSSGGKTGWFDNELLDIQKQLPDGVYMQICINCAFSDYHPVGYPAFGGMACFRNKKQEYINVKTKGDLFRVWGTDPIFVQETYHCPEFERRKPGTGYRG